MEGITHEWIYTHVVPSIRFRFKNDNRLCYVLGLSLLYAAMTEGDKQILVPELIRRRIRFAYHQLGQDKLQPVQKIPLLVQRKDDQLDINEYIEIDGLSQVGMIDGSVAHMEYFQSILVWMNQLEHLMNNYAAQSEASLSDMRSFITQKVRILNNNIRIFGGTMEGSFRIQQANTGRRLQRIDHNHIEDEIEPMEVADMATLSSNPRSLMELWREFQFGIDGRKAVQNFTVEERNRTQGGIKQKYYQQRFVWNAIDHLIRSGMTAKAAIGKLRDVYGHNTSVTRIIEQIRRDKKIYEQIGGYHPNLV